MDGFLLWFVVIANVVGFAAMGFDKLLAIRGARRIPELHLYVIAALTGAIGVWGGASVWRHKTVKRSFRVRAALATAVNALWVWLYLRS